MRAQTTEKGEMLRTCFEFNVCPCHCIKFEPRGLIVRGIAAANTFVCVCDRKQAAWNVLKVEPAVLPQRIQNAGGIHFDCPDRSQRRRAGTVG